MTHIQPLKENYTLLLISKPDLDRFWPHCAPWLQQGIDATDEGIFNLRSVHTQIQAEAFQLWAVAFQDKTIIASAVTKITRYLTDEVFFETFLLGGTDFPSYAQEAMAIMNGWAKKNHATRSRILGRKGFMKLFPDYAPTHVILQKYL